MQGKHCSFFPKPMPEAQIAEKIFAVLKKALWYGGFTFAGAIIGTLIGSHIPIIGSVAGAAAGAALGFEAARRWSKNSLNSDSNNENSLFPLPRLTPKFAMN